ncbi:MAG: gliding motility-associated C-terminal domain-containing protein [Bacteroidota bacterium]
MKKLFKYLLFIISCLISHISYSQTNLVPNPSFEDTISCPNNYSQIYLAPPWNTPTLGTPDYYNSCSAINCCSVPVNWGGSENPRTGKAYAGFYTFSINPMVSNSIREYIQVRLDSVLKQDEKYCIAFYVSLAENTSDYAVNNIGAYFSATAVSGNNFDPLPYVPQVENTFLNPLINANGWIKISGQFVSQGGEQYITIGNFNSNAASDTVYIKSTTFFKISYYYIDDVSVVHIDADAGKDTAICKGSSIVIGRAASPGLTYSWQPAIGLSSDTISQPIATPTVTTTYYLTATLNGGCEKQDTITVTVVDANAGNDTMLCEGNSVTLGTPALNGVAYSWQPAAGLNNTATAQPTATPITTTTYTLTASANGCTQTDAVSITVNPNPIINIGADLTISYGDSITLNTTGNGTYKWVPATGLNCGTCKSPKASPLSTTDYCLTVQDTNGCTASDCITVVVDRECEIFIPNAFSPDNSGENDLECVYGKCIETMEFSIYDRWGEKVFETFDPANCWDGTYNGKPMNTGVFAYYFNGMLTTGEQIIKKGNISLIR